MSVEYDTNLLALVTPQSDDVTSTGTLQPERVSSWEKPRMVLSGVRNS